MPAKAGIQNYLKTLDSRLRGNDAKGRFKTSYETSNIDDATFFESYGSFFLSAARLNPEPLPPFIDIADHPPYFFNDIGTQPRQAGIDY